MYCFTISDDEKLLCSSGYSKPSDNNFEPQTNFEIIPNCNRDHNDGFIDSILIEIIMNLMVFLLFVKEVIKNFYILQN